MLDLRTFELLKLLYKLCPSGSYKIVSSDEMIEEFPARYGADKDLIRQMIVNLSQKGFLSLRYEGEGEYCMSLTPEGRLYFENESKKKIDKKCKITDLLPYFFNFLSIFTAIFLAETIIKIVW